MVPEAPLTSPTPLGLLSCVDPLVDAQILAPAELLPTGLTPEWSLPSMDMLVQVEVGSLAETPATCVTHIGLVSCMVCQCCASAERKVKPRPHTSQAWGFLCGRSGGSAGLPCS